MNHERVSENSSEALSMTRWLRFLLTPEITSRDDGYRGFGSIPDSLGWLKAVCWYAISVVVAIGIAGLH